MSTTTGTRYRVINWTIFLALSVIWGSSFILMKEGLKTLSAYQVASIRILSAGLVLLPVAVKQINKIPYQKLHLIILSGLTGSFFPAFLFCIAETRIDSALTGILNSLTPIFSILLGVLFFKATVHWKKFLGVLIGFAGLCVLFLGKGKVELNFLSYASLVLLATVCYGFNVNLVNRYLKEVGSLNIASFAFAFLTIPSFCILAYSGFFSLPLLEKSFLVSTSACTILGVLGTAIATVIFYMLVKRTGVLFTSMVTYAIPVVAIFWGVLDNEGITLLEVVSLVIILGGVALTTK